MPQPSTPAMAISEAEAQVMEFLWQHHPTDAGEIAAALKVNQGWQLTTVKTLLGRLMKKGAVAADVEGRRYIYRPLLLREDWLSAHSLGLVDRLFDGRLAPLVAHFGSHRKLRVTDIQALKKLIQEYEK